MFSSTRSRVRPLIRTPSGGRVEDRYLEIGAGGAVERPAHALGLHRVRGRAEPGRVGENGGKPGNVEVNLDHVAGGAGAGRDDRRLAPRQAVEKARLADVRRAHDGDVKALAKALAAPFIVQVSCDRAMDIRGAAAHSLDDALGQVLVGKVDRRLGVGQRRDQRLPPALAQRPQLAIQLAQGLAPLRFGLGVDEIGETLGLGQVELAVVEGAPRELSGGGRAKAGERRQRRHQRPDDGASTVDVEFHDVLAGEAARRGKP